jgi:RimJ/RimL family protein N-acetyltransferase
MKLVCDKRTFRPVDTGRVRWVDRDRDFPMVRDYTPFPLTREHWERAHREGYRYCLIEEDGRIAAWAGERRLSDAAREVVDVQTDPAWRRLGYGKAVLSFVTAHIFSVCPLAICETRDDNVAMMRTAEAIGYRKVDTRR